MKNKLLTIFLALNFFQSYWSQNSALIFAPKYTINNQPFNLPTYGTINTNYWEGYKGQAAKSAQNIIVDHNNEIVFFIVDQYIYSKTGKLIDVFTGTPPSESSGSSVSGLVSEIAVVPAPGDCNTFHLMSTQMGSNQVTFAQGYYAKLVVKYDALNNVLPGSGLELLNGYNCHAKGVHFSNIIGPVYYGNNNVHDEGPRYAIADRVNTNNKFLFVLNGTKLFRLKIDNNGISYEDTINLLTAFPNNNSITESLDRRQELEIVLKSDGNYRIAFAMEHNLSIPNGASKSVFIFDMDNTGTLIDGTQKIARYAMNVNAPSNFEIKGIELSPDGSKLYVSHMSDVVYPGSLDIFDLSTSTPVKTVISTTNEFQYSQIEASFDNTILIPHANGLARISNANDPYTGNININYLTIPFPLSTPFPNQDAYKLRLLQDQIDGMDYSFISNNSYNADIYNTTAINQTWTPNGGGAGNPLIVGNGSIAYIRKELRIKAGTTLTIQNMEFRFAPGARVVVENSTTSVQGGKLILNNTIFSNDNRCGKNELWLGVEVWGNATQTQGTITNSKQGRLFMNNYAKIENAWVGALIGKRNSTLVEEIPFLAGDCEVQNYSYYSDYIVSLNSFDNAQNGGIIRASNNCIFLNNQKGVYFKPYTAAGGVNNLSAFSKTHFRWNGILYNGVTAVNIHHQAKLEGVKGIQFSGCEFVNETPNLYSYNYMGTGIQANESQFYVVPQCNTMSPPPCQSQTVCEFKDLKYGIYAANSDNTKSFTCSESNFINNQYGIYVRGTQSEEIIQNNFKIRETAAYQCAGLAMYSSSAYHVEANEFSEQDNPLINNGAGYSYGIVVNNSGDVKNEIYRNRFHNLKIGGQTERINATEITTTNCPEPECASYTMRGLVWKCNDFQGAIKKNDLTLINGRMKHEQGAASGVNSQLEGQQKAAGNKFSLTGELLSTEHDIMVSTTSQRLTYAYIDAPRHRPDSYTPNKVDVNDVLFNALPITSDLEACPSTIFNKYQIGTKELSDIKAIISTKQGLLDKGAESSLLTLIENGSDDAVKNKLLEVSPYLSDEVLLAYIASNPPSGHLKQVMIVNSQLSNEVKKALLNYSMPNGVANQIAAKQKGLSERKKLQFELNSLKDQYDEIYNERIRQALLDEDENANYDQLISILKEEGDEERLKLLLSTYIVKKDVVKIQETRDELAVYSPDVDFLELTNIQEEISKEASAFDALETNLTLKNKLENLKNNGSDKRIVQKATCLLEMHGEMSDVPEFLSGISEKMMVEEKAENPSEQIDLSKVFTVNMYPNPSTGLVTIDYPNQEDGELKIEVIDLTGKIAFVSTFTSTNGQQIDLKDLHKGMYLVRILIDDVLIENQKLKLQ